MQFFLLIIIYGISFGAIWLNDNYEDRIEYYTAHNILPGKRINTILLKFRKKLSLVYL